MLKAVRDMVIIRLFYAEQMRGLYIADQAKTYHGDFHGETMSIGPEYPDKSLKVGDKVYFHRAGAPEGVPVYFGGEKLWALKERYFVARELNETTTR